jgi:hypothetical protein
MYEIVYSTVVLLETAFKVGRNFKKRLLSKTWKTFASGEFKTENLTGEPVFDG